MSYSLEWERLFMIDEYSKKLKDMGMNGDLRSSRFRSVCWKVSSSRLAVEKPLFPLFV